MNNPSKSFECQNTCHSSDMFVKVLQIPTRGHKPRGASKCKQTKCKQKNLSSCLLNFLKCPETKGF